MSVCMYVCLCFFELLLFFFGGCICFFFVQIVQPRKLFTWGVSVCLSVSGVSLGLLVMGICTPMELSLAQLHKWFLEVQDPPIIRANLRQMVFGSKRSCKSSCKSASDSLQKKKSNFIIEPKTAAHLGQLSRIRTCNARSKVCKILGIVVLCNRCHCKVCRS